MDRPEKETYTVRVCSLCGEAVTDTYRYRDRWECPEHGSGITIRFVETQPVSGQAALQTRYDLLELTVRRVAEKLRLPSGGWSSRLDEAAELEEAVRR